MPRATAPTPSASFSTARSAATDAGTGSAGTGADGAGGNGFGVYVHWPFCRSKCPYCDFNSHVRETVDHEAWARALEAEVAHAAADIGPRTLDSIFFGGGTPSLMPPATVARVLAAIDRAWGLPQGCEISLEANPTSVEAGRFAGLAAAGVNRVSLGLQALVDDDLRFLGRQHTAAEGLAAFDIARQHFARTSFDLIYARPDQSLEAWEAELGRALALGPTHLSLYQLTIEPGTAFAAWHGAGRFAMPSDDLSADFYGLTQAITEAGGLPAYEVSNHAAPGEACRHNLVYWRAGEWAAIGPGAHGRHTAGDGGRIGLTRLRQPEAWLHAVGRHGHGQDERFGIDAADARDEAAIMGLRLVEGIALDRLGLSAVDRPVLALVEAGYARVAHGRIAATTEGRLRLNALIAHLVGDDRPLN